MCHFTEFFLPGFVRLAEFRLKKIIIVTSILESVGNRKLNNLLDLSYSQSTWRGRETFHASSLTSNFYVWLRLKISR